MSGINAAGSRHSLALVPETTYAAIPASPALVSVRHNSTTLQLSRAHLQSAELRADRQISGFRSGTRMAAGDIIAEVAQSPGFDQLLAMALMGSWVPVADSTVTSISAAAGSFTIAAGSFVTDGFVVGQVVVASGFATAGNNGRFTVTAVAALTLSVTPLQGQTMGTDAAAAGREIVSANATVKVSTQRPSVTIESYFQDITQYLRFRGCEVNKLAMHVKASTLSTATFTLMANDVDPMAQAPVAGATYGAISTTQPMTGLTAAVLEGGSPLALISDISIALDNKLTANYVVGQANSLLPSVGKSTVTGTATLYFADSTMYNKFLNETSSTLQFTLQDVVGNSYQFFCPNIRYTGAPLPVQNEGPVSIAMPFQALVDPTTATNIEVTRVVMQ